MIKALYNKFKLVTVAILLLGAVLAFGALHSLNQDVGITKDEQVIFAEDIEEKRELLPDVLLIKKIMQKAAEFVSFTMPV